MAKVLALYRTPKDVAAFDRYYHATHIPLAKTIPGLRKYEISKGAVSMPAGPSGLHLVAVLEFDSAAAVRDALGSPQGKATAADLGNFADGGVELLIFDTAEV